MTEEEKIKYLYDRHHADRDFQLTMFWENSKYYWGFLLVCFGGYGALVLNSLWKEGIDCVNCNLILIAIDVIGIVLSWAWLKMAQGCKAWYEVHENAIWKMDRENKLGLPSNYFDENFFVLRNFEKKNRSFRSDSYSPTKINIMLCYIVLSIWFILLFVNSIFVFNCYCIVKIFHFKNYNSLCLSAAIVLFCVIVLGVFLIKLDIIDTKIRSSEINHFKYLFVDELRKLNCVTITPKQYNEGEFRNFIFPNISISFNDIDMSNLFEKRTGIRNNEYLHFEFYVQMPFQLLNLKNLNDTILDAVYFSSLSKQIQNVVEKLDMTYSLNRIHFVRRNVLISFKKN